MNGANHDFQKIGRGIFFVGRVDITGSGFRLGEVICPSVRVINCGDSVIDDSLLSRRHHFGIARLARVVILGLSKPTSVPLSSAQ